MNSKNKKILFIACIIVAVTVVITYFVYKKPVNAQYDEFAQCLSEKKVTMYGAAWCSHCQNQKKLFGSSFQYVPYVECPKETKLCLEKGVQGYPTWILENGTKLVGEQKLEELSVVSGCQLPQETN